ncbi:MAG: hypothetical protein AB1414_09680 [bacterium]
MATTLTISDSTVIALQRLLTTKPATLIQNNTIKGVLLHPQQYETLLQLLEDLEDLRDAQIAEAEHATGQGRSFDEYDSERRKRQSRV